MKAFTNLAVQVKAPPTWCPALQMPQSHQDTFSVNTEQEQATHLSALPVSFSSRHKVPLHTKPFWPSKLPTLLSPFLILNLGKKNYKKSL